MSYLTVVLEGGPLHGGRVPMHGDTVRYGHLLELEYTEEVQTSARSDYGSTSNEGTARRTRRAIYKCMAGVGENGESDAVFVGVLQ